MSLWSQNWIKKGGIKSNKEKRIEKLQNILETFDLQGILRIKHPETKRYTWHKKPSLLFNVGWIIGLLDTLQDFNNNVNIISSVRSDHSGITMHIKSLTNRIKARITGNSITPFFRIINIFNKLMIILKVG